MGGWSDMDEVQAVRVEGKTISDEVKTIKIKDILFINLEYVNKKSYIAYHTKDSTYLHVFKFEQVIQIYNEKIGFSYVDRGVIANLKNVKQIDTELGKIYFDDPLKKSAPWTTIAHTKIIKIREIILNLLGREL